jgi:hypothetical protein
MVGFEINFQKFKVKTNRYINTVIFDSKLPWYGVWFGRFIPWMFLTALLGSRFKYLFYFIYSILFTLKLIIPIIIFF